MTSKPTTQEPNVSRDPPTRSIWDADVDAKKLEQLTPSQRAKMFPNDYDSDGKPYGDF